MNTRLLLFTRFPRPGAAKTRLIPLLGEAGAADLHRELTEHTLQTLDATVAAEPYELEIRYTGGSEDELAAWLGNHRLYAEQGDGDLGRRMDRAMGEAFEAAASRVVLVGSDCPELSPGRIQRAFDLLITTDVVLGPALDGGYYLVGVRRTAWDRARGPLFTDMRWSTDEVLAESMRRLHAAGLETERLDFLGDVDRSEDLLLWERVRQKKRQK